MNKERESLSLSLSLSCSSIKKLFDTRNSTSLNNKHNKGILCLFGRLS